MSRLRASAPLFHIVRTVRRAWLPALLGAALLIPVPARGTSLRIVTANDFLTKNKLSDDLYTAAIELEVTTRHSRVRFGENLFTDSERNLRFDETYVAVERPLREIWGWRASVEVGAIRVGKGLIGQSGQNLVHRVIGDDEVDLPYIDSNHVFPTLGVRFEQPLPSWHRLTLATEVELYSAFDFKQHAATSVRAHWPAFRSASLDFELGGRYSRSDFAPLKPRVARLAPTWEAAVTIYDRMIVSWNYNHYGTKSQHFVVKYDFRLGGDRRRG